MQWLFGGSQQAPPPAPPPPKAPAALPRPPSPSPAAAAGSPNAAALRRSVSLNDLSGDKRCGEAACYLKVFPSDPDAYELLDDCGRGVSARVYRARVKSSGDVVGIKICNLDQIEAGLQDLIQEAQKMRKYQHPNLLPLYAAFVTGQELWMVMPFMWGGSVAHIMRYSFPDGISEVAIATIMREVLQGLAYVHGNGDMHRDVKAGNILIDKDGSVKLGDFGVAATMERSRTWGHDRVQRRSMVGTPAWMAPEVLDTEMGYGPPADIWSCGITMLEMAHGHAPFAQYPPLKVMLLTIQSVPPALEERIGQRTFSRHMREVVAACLSKSPGKRPTAAELLEHRFFRQARDKAWIVRHLLSGLPPLSERVQRIRAGKAATRSKENVQALRASQEQYAAGIADWNFEGVKLPAVPEHLPDGASAASPAGSESGGRPPSPSTIGSPSSSSSSDLQRAGQAAGQLPGDDNKATAAPAAAGGAAAAAVDDAADILHRSMSVPFFKHPPPISVAGAAPVAGAAAPLPPPRIDAGYKGRFHVFKRQTQPVPTLVEAAGVSSSFAAVEPAGATPAQGPPPPPLPVAQPPARDERSQQLGPGPQLAFSSTLYGAPADAEAPPAVAVADGPPVQLPRQREAPPSDQEQQRAPAAAPSTPPGTPAADIQKKGRFTVIQNKQT